MDWEKSLVHVTETLVAGGLVVFALQAVLEHRRKKAEERAEAKHRVSLLRLFALEAVELQERWVQYVRQGVGTSPQISRSSPFEITTPEQLQQLIKLGVRIEIISAIYFVKELTNDVRRVVIQAQQEASRLVALPPEIVNQLDHHQIEAPQTTFNSAAAFVRDRWDRVSKGVDAIVAEAEVGGDVSDLRKRVKASCDEYNKYKNLM